MRLAPVKDCKIRNLQLDQTSLAEPNSPRRCHWKMQPPGKKTEAFLLICTENTRKNTNKTKTSSAMLFFSNFIVGKTKTLSHRRNTHETHYMKSNYYPKLLFKISLQPIREEDSFVLRTTCWLFAGLPKYSVVKPVLTMSDRWVNFGPPLRGGGKQAHH